MPVVAGMPDQLGPQDHKAMQAARVLLGLLVLPVPQEHRDILEVLVQQDMLDLSAQLV
jgi:hypothetical protein